MNKEFGYLQFPLCLIRETYKDVTEGIEMIISYGIVNYAMKLPYEIENIAKQLIYDYSRRYEKLQKNVKEILIKNKDHLIIENELLFTSEGEFNPDEYALDVILDLFKEEPELEIGAILNYQLHLAVSENHLNLTIRSNDYNLEEFRKAKKIQDDFESKYGPDAMPMCKANILFDFRDKYISDIDILRAYIGIRSLLGQNKYIATTRPVILMRMLGCKNKITMQDFIRTNMKAKEVFKRITRTEKSLRYHFGKLFNQLLKRGLIKSRIFDRKVSRKIFISIRLDFNELADEIIKFAQKSDFKEMEKEAISKIRATI